MGVSCSKSDAKSSVPTPLPTPTPDPTPEPEPESEIVATPEPDEESSSDFVIQIEDPSKDEVQIEKTFNNYPSPKPTAIDLKQPWGTSIKWFDNWTPQMNDDIGDVDPKGQNNVVQDQSSLKILTSKDVDDRAKKAPAELNQSFSGLIKYLTQDLHNSERPELLKVRALIVWLSNQDVDSRKRMPGNKETPEGFLSLLAQKRSTYGTFFTFLCREAGIQCVLIEGICKAGRSYQPGNMNTADMACVWTAVFFEDQWHIVHPFWVCRSLVGHHAGGWIKLEAGGKSIGKREEAAEGVIRNAFKEYYFLTDPKEFIYYCHPNDKKWQLLERPISREKFLTQENVFPTFFGLGLQLSQKSCSLHSNRGETKIEVEAPAKNANAIDLWYELLLREENDNSSTENLLQQQENLPKFVAMIRCGERWKFKIQFPIEGTYKLCIYGSPHKSALLRIAEFRIDCSARKENCIPLPIDPGIIGFGPGPASEDAGLHFPSHRNGIYPIRKNDTFKVRFRLEQNVVESLAVRSTLLKTVQTEKGVIKNSELTQAVKTQIFKKRMELEITASITSDGEYALTISTDSTDVVSSYKNVCNYLLTSNLQQTREKANQRNARRNLQDSMDDDTEDTKFEYRADIIQKAIDKCLSQKISDEDEEIESARIRVQYLKARKEIHDAYMRRHVDVTANTIKRLQQSRFVYTLRQDIQKLVKFYEKLEKEKQEREETYTRKSIVSET